MKYIFFVLLFISGILTAQQDQYLQSLQGGRDTLIIDRDTLYKQDLFSPDFYVETEYGEYDYEPGHYYASDSSVLAVFDSLVIGNINGKNFINGIFFEPISEAPDSFICMAPDPGWLPIHMVENEVSKVTKKVRVYFIIRNNMVTKMGVKGAVDYLTSIFVAVQKIYKNEGIHIEISSIRAFEKKDPFGSGSTFDRLSKVKDFLKGKFNGDLAHTIDLPNRKSGGIAWVDVLCAKSHAIAFSEIDGHGAKFPKYSWDVSVIAHEMGHNLGSPHTHSCSWPGGPIDNCYKKEGNCNTNGDTPKGGGTIMSYCHLTSHGVNFLKGFGTIPGNLIRHKVNSATCLQDVDEEPNKPTCLDGVQNGNETGIDCGGDCEPCKEIEYCSPGKPNSGTEWIKEVVINQVKNASASEGYKNNTNVIFKLQKGSTATIALSPGFKNRAYPEGWSVYIDWDQNGFQNNERVFFSKPSNKDVTGTFKVPKNAISGNTRMRVQMGWNYIPKVCQDLRFGEIEDYTIKVIDAGDCDPPKMDVVMALNIAQAIVSKDVTQVDFYTNKGKFTDSEAPFGYSMDDCEKSLKVVATNDCGSVQKHLFRIVKWDERTQILRP